MSVRAFTNLVLAMPRDSVFWQLVQREPATVEGADASALLRRI
jgi:hypothetical protein